MDIIRITEEFTVSALHNLEDTQISGDENEKLYGACYRKHGHDYHIQIQLEAQIDPMSGIAFDRLKLKEILDSTMIERLNGTFLNHHFDCTSGEALSVYFYNLLKKPLESGLTGVRVTGLHIQETRKNWFSFGPHLTLVSSNL